MPDLEPASDLSHKEAQLLEVRHTDGIARCPAALLARAVNEEGRSLALGGAPGFLVGWDRLVCALEPMAPPLRVRACGVEVVYELGQVYVQGAHGGWVMYPGAMEGVHVCVQSECVYR